MVEMCNEASRAGVGEFVWASWDTSHWEPRPKKAKYRAQTPTAGAHFYSLTAKGARFLLNQRIAGKFDEAHMGTTLAHLLRAFQENDSGEFGCCYLNPPVGNYVAHETTTNANVRLLPSHFDESWLSLIHI